jgi:hypothetical protein
MNVQIAHHLPGFGDLLGRHLAERLLHALEGLIQHLLLQLIHQLLELLPRLRIHEVVLLQAANLAGGIVRQLVELLVAFLRDGVQQVTQPVLIGRSPLPFSAIAAFLPVLGVISLGRLGGFIEPLLDSRALGIDHILESLADVIEHGTEVVALHLFLPGLPDTIHEIAQTGEALGVRSIHAFPEQTAQGIHEIAVAHELVGHRAHQVVGAEIVDLLGTIPAGVAGAVSGECHWVGPGFQVPSAEMDPWARDDG